jgi:hypothetical protein
MNVDDRIRIGSFDPTTPRHMTRCFQLDLNIVGRSVAGTLMDQCFLYKLPNEILQDKLMVLLPKSDLAAIHRASTLLYDLSTRALYRRISLTKSSQLVRCCKTLVGTNFRVEVVHEFVIDIPRSVCPGHFVVIMSYTVGVQFDRSTPVNDPTSQSYSEALALSERPQRSYKSFL